jgi:signal transduction histidine kinase
MRERIRLVGGEILIKSGPGTGTTIHARVPLSQTMTPAGPAV